MANFIANLYQSTVAFLSQTSPLVTFLSLLVGIAGLIFALWALARKRQLGQLSFYSEQTIELFDTIAQGVPHLEIRYKDAPILSNLVLTKGVFQNTGKIDIDQGMVKNKLTIVLDEGLVWKESSVKTPFANKIASKIISDRKVQIDFDLLKPGEFFEVECLIEVPPDIRVEEHWLLKNHFNFTCRIKDTQKTIKKGNMILFPRRKGYSEWQNVFLASFGLYLGSMTIIFSEMTQEMGEPPSLVGMVLSGNYRVIIGVLVASMVILMYVIQFSKFYKAKKKQTTIRKALKRRTFQKTS